MVDHEITVPYNIKLRLCRGLFGPAPNRLNPLFGSILVALIMKLAHHLIHQLEEYGSNKESGIIKPTRSTFITAFYMTKMTNLVGPRSFVQNYNPIHPNILSYLIIYIYASNPTFNIKKKN